MFLHKNLGICPDMVVCNRAACFWREVRYLVKARNPLVLPDLLDAPGDADRAAGDRHAGA